MRIELILVQFARFLRRLQKSIQRRVQCDSSEEMYPSDNATSPLLEKSPSLPAKVLKATHFKLNRQTRVSPYYSLDVAGVKGKVVGVGDAEASEVGK